MSLLRTVTERINFHAQNLIFRYMCPELVTVGGMPALQRQLQPEDNWLNGDGFLWVTPKRRRNVETRASRRFGAKEWGSSKMIELNKRIRVDNNTGEYFELGKLAPLSYKKIMQETKLIQQRMAESFGTGTPKDQDVVVLYKGEKKEVPENLRVIEMDTERPNFFSTNLMQKTRVIDDKSQTVKPSGLG
jgi:large subunit ribosomal protein L32